MRSVSIVMTYFNRPVQLRNTLRSIKHYNSNFSDIHLIVVDDGSDKTMLAKDVIKEVKIPAQVIYVQPKQKTWINPSVPYNLGFNQVVSDVVLIQNSECVHLGPLVEIVREDVTDENYLTFATYSLGQAEFEKLKDVETESWRSRLVLQADGHTILHSSGWYHHPKFNPTNYHFAAALTQFNLAKIGGFDERFAKGYCFEDNAFLWRVSQAQLQIVTPPIERAFVVHQWHSKNPSLVGSCAEWQKNNKLYNQLVSGKIPADWRNAKC